MTRLKWLTSPLGLVVVFIGAAAAIALLIDVISITGNQIQTGDYAEDAFDLQLSALPESGTCETVEESDWQDGPAFVDGSFDETFSEIRTGEIQSTGDMFCLRRADQLADDMSVYVTTTDYVGTDPACSPNEVDVDPVCGTTGTGQIVDHFLWGLVIEPPLGNQAPCQLSPVEPWAILSEAATYLVNVIPASASGEPLCAAFVVAANLDHNAALEVQSDSATWTWEIEGGPDQTPPNG